jgi:predicted O-methyltransferase YrrM
VTALKLPQETVQIKRAYPPAPTRFMSQMERYALAELANNISARTIIETGVNEGTTAKWLIENVPTIIHYVGVDVPVGYMPKFVQQASEVSGAPGRLAFQFYDKFQLTVCARGSFDLEAKDLPRADMFLIDGDHGREAVLNDTKLATELVNKGGLIIWHDYKLVDDRGRPDPCNVVDVLDELHSLGRPLVHIAGTWLVMERR